MAEVVAESGPSARSSSEYGVFDGTSAREVLCGSTVTPERLLGATEPVQIGTSGLGAGLAGVQRVRHREAVGVHDRDELADGFEAKPLGQ